MSAYSYAGREKLANWLINCLYVDLVISAFLVFLNYVIVFDYIRVHAMETAIIAGMVLAYVVIVDTIKEKLRKHRTDEVMFSAEIIASLYLLLHWIFYIFVSGSAISGLFLGTGGLSLSTDFLLSWSIIISVVLLVIFYRRNAENSRSQEPIEKKHTDRRWDLDENAEAMVYGTVRKSDDRNQYPVHSRSQSGNHTADMDCFVCGKRDLLPLRGRDGRHYCREHILPENRGTSPEAYRSESRSVQKPDTRCENPRCRRAIYHEDIIKCGPCGNLFCKHCWENHRWSHGKSPAVGINYSANGTFSGFDGTEPIKK
jgi:hypothetical protein